MNTELTVQITAAGLTKLVSPSPTSHAELSKAVKIFVELMSQPTNYFVTYKDGGNDTMVVFDDQDL